MKTFLRFEKYFFLLLVALHLLPVLLLDYFVTHDGPSHVYNSIIIANLLGGDAHTAEFFRFNPDIVPNWLGHFLLCIFNFFVHGNISERILLCLYIAAFPLSFRHLLLTLNANAQWVSYLIFPFIYSLVFYLGFFNFCLGIPLMFWSIAYYVRNGKIFSRKNFLLLMLSGVLMYFSHLFVFVTFVLCAGIFLLTEFFIARLTNPQPDYLKSLFRKTGYLLLALSPPVILLVIFVFTKTTPDESLAAITLGQKFVFLFNARPLITFRFDDEVVYSTVIACVFWFIFLYTFSRRLRQRGIFSQDSWLFTAIAILIAYFVVPDAMASGSFVSHRLLLFFYFFSLIWVAMHPFPFAGRLFSVPVFSLLSLIFLVYHYKESENLSSEANEYVSTAKYIEPNSVVLPVSYSANWLHSNLSDYLSVENKFIILDNYEADKPHFPTEWIPEKNPYTGMNFTSASEPCLAIEHYEKIAGIKIDYIIRWGFNMSAKDSCAMVISDYITKNYSHLFTTENNKAEVFRRKKL